MTIENWVFAFCLAVGVSYLFVALIIRPLFWLYEHFIYYPYKRRQGYICDGKHLPYKPEDSFCYTIPKDNFIDPELPKIEYTPAGAAKVLEKMLEMGEKIEKLGIINEDRSKKRRVRAGFRRAKHCPRRRQI